MHDVRSVRDYHSSILIRVARARRRSRSSESSDISPTSAGGRRRSRASPGSCTRWRRSADAVDAAARAGPVRLDSRGHGLPQLDVAAARPASRNSLFVREFVGRPRAVEQADVARAGSDSAWRSIARSGAMPVPPAMKMNRRSSGCRRKRERSRPVPRRRSPRPALSGRCGASGCRPRRRRRAARASDRAAHPRALTRSSTAGAVARPCVADEHGLARA